MISNNLGLIATAIAFLMLSESAEAQRGPKTPDQRGYFEGGKYKKMSAAEKLDALW